MGGGGDCKQKQKYMFIFSLPFYQILSLSIPTFDFISGRVGRTIFLIFFKLENL